MVASALQDLQALVRQERLPDDFMSTVEHYYLPLATQIADEQRVLQRMMLVGICGPQGSGKSTLAEFLQVLLRHAGLRCVVLSIDDLYLTCAEREKLAREVHPLFKTRGPPGTHDVAMGLRLFDQLSNAGLGDKTLLPRFDKSIDDRAPEWITITGRPDIVLFEGWCVGARPQSNATLAHPVNALERERDSDGLWRRYVNDSLAGPYQTLFTRLDKLIVLRLPGFEQVRDWRELQEAKLRDKAPQGTRLMTPAEIAKFVMHYERVTRHILAEMPARADWVLEISPAQRIELLQRR